VLFPFAFLAALAAQPAEKPAEKDRLQANTRPVEMTARGGLHVDLKRQTGTAKGDVLIRRDDVLVCCDEADAKYSGNRLERVTCRGRVVIVRPNGARATANLAVFVAKEDRLTLSGMARVLTEDGDLTGDRIIYDIGQDRLHVDGGRSRFKWAPGPGPKADAEAPSRPCPPPGGASQEGGFRPARTDGAGEDGRREPPLPTERDQE
jgi:lipopolysaccharide transport protein LptA